MHVAAIRTDGTVELGEQARALGYRPGVLVCVIRTSADTLILALHDEPVLIEAPAKRLSGPGRRALTRRGKERDAQPSPTRNYP